MTTDLKGATVHARVAGVSQQVSSPSMQDHQRVPIVLWILWGIMLFPLAMMTVGPFAVILIVRNPAFSAVFGALIASTVIRRIVQSVNRRDDRRRISVPNENDP